MREFDPFVPACNINKPWSQCTSDELDRLLAYRVEHGGDTVELRAYIEERAKGDAQMAG